MHDCACGCGEQTYNTYKHGHHTRLFTPEEQSRRAQFNDGNAMRGLGEGKAYRKLRGRHEHRVVAEQKLERALLPDEVVHHIDGNHLNNHPDNLEVMTQAEHIKLHWAEMKAAKDAKRI